MNDRNAEEPTRYVCALLPSSPDLLLGPSCQLRLHCRLGAPRSRMGARVLCAVARPQPEPPAVPCLLGAGAVCAPHRLATLWGLSSEGITSLGASTATVKAASARPKPCFGVLAAERQCGCFPHWHGVQRPSSVNRYGDDNEQPSSKVERPTSFRRTHCQYSVKRPCIFENGLHIS
jgi:hypothetical protein